MVTNASLSFDFPAIGCKEAISRFDGGDITSDAGVLLLARADQKIDIVGAMTGEILDNRQASKVRHSVASLLRQRIFAIACGYEDANDFVLLPPILL